MKHTKTTRMLRRVQFWLLLGLSILVSIFNNLHYMDNNLVDYSLVSLFAFLIALMAFIKKILVIYIEGVYRNTGAHYAKNVEKYERKYRATSGFVDAISLSLDISFFIALFFMVLSTLDIFDVLHWSVNISNKYLSTLGYTWLISLGDILINIIIILGIYGLSLYLEKGIMHLANRFIPKFKHLIEEMEGSE